jgi:hypothetical protein
MDPPLLDRGSTTVTFSNRSPKRLGAGAGTHDAERNVPA